MTAYLASTIFVVLAEMGDKTQLLGMAFAAKFKARTVLAGVFVATLLNHLLAVIAGDYLTKFIPLPVIQLIAAISFVIFGLWTLRGDTLGDEDQKTYFTPFWTVTIAFFMAEMGDKTQLATVALAAKYQDLFGVWMGTTTGMMISNILGIAVGVILGKKIPEKLIKVTAAGIFILFGYAGLWDSVTGLGAKRAAIGLTTLAVAAYLVYLKLHSSPKEEKPADDYHH